MTQEMYTIAQELFKLVREHSESDCSDNCCVRELLNNLSQKKNSESDKLTKENQLDKDSYDK